MISQIKAFFNDHILEAEREDPAERIRLATAALLTEVMLIDGKSDKAEGQAIRNLLEAQFKLAPAQSRELVDLAADQVRSATSLYQFTELVNRHFSMSEKEELMISLWKVAFADGSLDKYEEATIRKIAELIHISHTAFIQAKHIAR